MANNLKPFWRAGLMIVIIAAMAQAQAQSLKDPTRPADATTASGLPSSEASVQGTVLQSVVLQKGKKPVALISGQVVPLGGKYGESRLISLTEKEAVLSGPDGQEKLLLTPGIEKKAVKESSQKTVTKRAYKRKL